MNKEFDEFLRRVGDKAGQHGYVRNGNYFRKQSGDFLSLIEFQKSKDGVPGEVKFTVNLGVVWRRLLGVFDSFEKAKIVDAHLMERMGFLLDERRDRWWVISSSSDLAVVEDEISSILEDRAIPYLEKYSNAPALVGLWNSGISPGLTKVQCERFLKKISGK